MSSIFDNNLVTGQSQSGMWFGTTDDLWRFGKPQGWGGPWRYDMVTAGTPSDPYLMTGFDSKVVHLRVDPPYPAAVAVNITIQVGPPPQPGARAHSLERSPGGESQGLCARWVVASQVDFTGSAGHRGAYFYFEPWNTVTRVSVPLTQSADPSSAW